MPTDFEIRGTTSTLQFDWVDSFVEKDLKSILIHVIQHFKQTIFMHFCMFFGVSKLQHNNTLGSIPSLNLLEIQKEMALKLIEVVIIEM